MPPSPSTSAVRSERGFALVLTVTLLAFLVLILVALASLTRVETQVATNNQQLAQARQNALMALNIALGQLQKYAGPDQRTTARADIDATLVNKTNANGRWTGVYGNAVAANYNATPENIAKELTDSANLTPKGSPARRLNWLVSGNENTSFDPTTDVADDGHIKNAPAAFAFTPDSTVDLTALSTIPTIADIQTLLVGSNSVTTPNDYVGAPLVKVEVPEGAIPGFSASSTALKTIGRYAWWVGDEGMKARLDLPLAGSDTTLNADEKLDQQRNAFSNSTRAAIELMASDDRDNWAATPPTENLIGTEAYDPAAASLKRLLATSQLPMMASTASAANTLRTAAKYRFHDLTPYSSSVLSDTYAGGLKRDLSILLDENYTPAANDPTADTKRMWTLHSGDTGGFVSGGGYGVPTWKHLRSYVQTRIPISGPNVNSLPVTLPANDKTDASGAQVPDDVGVCPIITYFSLGFGMGSAGPPNVGEQIHMYLYPLVVLWNPYNFTLRAPDPEPLYGGNYEVGIIPGWDGQVFVDLQVKRGGTFVTIGEFNFRRASSLASNGNFIRFRLDCPDIPPGQSLIFSLPPGSSGQLYNQRNILENREPEPGAYVSVPIRDKVTGPIATIQEGELDSEYQLAESTGSNSNSNSFKTHPTGNSNGGLNIYLGKPSNASRVDATGGSTPRNLFNPSSSNRLWYNTHQEVNWSGVILYPPFQEPRRLDELYDLVLDGDSQPAYVFQSQALFSGKGNNSQYNNNQYVFATRWLAQGNMRATRTGRTRRDNDYNVLFNATAGQPLYNFPWQKFNNAPGAESHRVSAGEGHDIVNGAPVDAKLFEFPYLDQHGQPLPLFSIGQLQHANLSLVGDYPAYPIGNSLGDFRLVSGGTSFPSTPEGWQLARVDKGTNNPQGVGFLGADMNGYYDISYLLNHTLWDRYYFSTVPATGTIAPTDVFPNTRHLRYNTSVDVQNPDRSAAGLILAGGFNINSTSEQAWRAVLGGSNQLVFDPENPDSLSSKAPLKATFPRFSRPNADDNPDNVWEGYRTLDENQIAQLARNIVTQIRNRGPFVSLADFINRRLSDNTATTGENETYRGTIQAAIDNMTAPSSPKYPANDPAGVFWSQDLLITSSGSHINYGNQYNMGYYGRAQVEGRLNGGTNGSITGSTAAARPYGGRSSFAPKYLTQADVLAKIGSGLTARSDTFTIRTYGETVNPATQEINGRAWCEAVVQRLPEYVEDNLKPWDTPTGGSANQTFGRKFKIVSFRWLSSKDI